MSQNRAPLPAIVIYALSSLNNYSWEWRARSLNKVEISISIIYLLYCPFFIVQQMSEYLNRKKIIRI